ncbi:YibE/F family protein [Ilumatobacter nonamiensis]|uniref:YibE/F family protein n=1 Tax=Ilumatobacter nonamiensis TaxID=467093 RepID=UPI00034DDDF1|nr:YibE/F family protein [Ilumatobacter nonamiensis]
MSHGHSHALPTSADEDTSNPRVRKALWATVGACTAIILLTVAVLWPDGTSERTDPLGLSGEPVAASVSSVEIEPCTFDGSQECELVTLRVTSGERDGETFTLEQPPGSAVDAGDDILVDILAREDGTEQAVFYDFQRETPLVLLAVIFCAAIVLLGGWRGFGALAGLAASLLIIVVFTLPALLAGSNAVAVALASSGAIALVALFLAHGRGTATAVALLSTYASLALTAALAAGFVAVSNLTGLGDENVAFISALGIEIDPRGLLLAGIVIGALGVLDDVTVTQVSAVWELRRVSPDGSFSDLYRSALRIGRDHISSTVNTLFLAYAGAALPLLLLFSEAGQGITDVATREIVAVEIVRALVGSIGLVASVPISTALAAFVLVGPAHDEASEQLSTV